MSTKDPMTDEVVRELHQRADALYDAPLSFADVRGRARGIRRRRRLTAVAGTAAAVAVVAALSSTLAGGLDRADTPQPAPQPTQGRGASVLHDGVVTLPGGTTVTVGVDNQDATDFGVLTDGRVVVASQTGKPIQVFAADGSPQASYAADYNVLTMSADDEVAAWPQDGHVWALESGDAEAVDLGRLPTMNGTVLFIDAVTGSGCATGGCEALLSDGTSTVARMTADGTERLRTSEPFRVTDVSTDGDTWAVSFVPEADHQYGCAGLYDPETDEVTARSCAANGLRFSPDGEHLLSSYFENGTFGNVTVLDHALEVVREIDPHPDVVSRVAWGDATHLLVAIADLDGGSWRLLREDIDGGEPDEVAGPVSGGNPEMMSEYQLSR